MAEAVSTTPQELAQQQQTQQAEQEHSRVHALDPDFLLVLSFAVLVDAIDIILELTSFLIVPKLLGLVLDAFTLFVLGWWMYWRLGKIQNTKRQQQAARKAGGHQGGAIVRGPLRKVLVRVGLVSIIEIIPLVGILFAWTVMVISTLREK